MVKLTRDSTNIINKLINFDINYSIKIENNLFILNLYNIICTTYKKIYDYKKKEIFIEKKNKYFKYPLICQIILEMINNKEKAPEKIGGAKLLEFVNFYGKKIDIKNIYKYMKKYYTIKTSYFPGGVLDVQKIIKNCNSKYAKILMISEQIELPINGQNPFIGKPDDISVPGYLNCNERLKMLLYDNMYIPINIINYIERQEIKCINVIIENIDLNLYIPTINIDLYNVNNIINRIIHICTIFKTISKINNEYTININIIFTEFKKKINYKDTFLRQDNINSGMTKRGEIINIWRYEEFEKVLIHELIHYFNFDFIENHKDFYTLQHFIKTNYHIVGKDYINESYTETLALIIHTLFCCFYMGNFNYFDNLLKLEVIYNTFQVGKIIKFFNGKKFDDIKTININQTTSVFSYFIIKCSLLYNIDNFLLFINNNIYFNNKFIKYKKLLKQSLNNICFVTNVDLLINKSTLNSRDVDLLINKSTEFNVQNSKDVFSDNSLRMSCLQLK